MRLSLICDSLNCDFRPRPSPSHHNHITIHITVKPPSVGTLKDWSAKSSDRPLLLLTILAIDRLIVDHYIRFQWYFLKDPFNWYHLENRTKPIPSLYNDQHQWGEPAYTSMCYTCKCVAPLLKNVTSTLASFQFNHILWSLRMSTEWGFTVNINRLHFLPLHSQYHPYASVNT